MLDKGTTASWYSESILNSHESRFLEFGYSEPLIVPLPLKGICLIQTSLISCVHIYPSPCCSTFHQLYDSSMSETWWVSSHFLNHKRFLLHITTIYASFNIIPIYIHTYIFQYINIYIHFKYCLFLYASGRWGIFPC